MATRNKTVSSETEASYPSYSNSSRMKNYTVIYDNNVKQTRCSFYKNKLINRNTEYDTSYTVESGYEYRLDLISYKFYGTSTYDWAIADANNIEDPIKDITIGKALKIPSINEI